MSGPCCPLGARLRWRSAIIRPGIPKEGNMAALESIESTQTLTQNLLAGCGATEYYDVFQVRPFQDLLCICTR